MSGPPGLGAHPAYQRAAHHGRNPATPKPHGSHLASPSLLTMVFPTPSGCKCGRGLMDAGTCLYCGHGDAIIDTTTVRHRSTLPEPVNLKAYRERRTPGPKRRWTEDQVVKTIRAFHRDTGRPPCANDWKYGAEHRPTTQTVIKLFGSWADAIEAAGYPRPTRRTRYTEPATLAA